jgi:phage shock protein PspC (stress-responsive transcriptional regulator)
MSDRGADLPQPLRRTRDGRWLAGVCSGIAQRWDVPVTQVRALFAVAAVLAGLGVLAYVACWLVLPVDDADESPSLVRAIASLALVAAAAAGLFVLGMIAGTATLFGFGWAVVVALAVFLVGALVAWPVVRPAWVLLPLAAVALPAVAVAVSDVRILPQAGLIVAAPQTPGDIPAGGYRAGLGDLFVDLRQFEAKPRAQVALHLDTGTGRTVVALPRDRCYDLDVTYRTGHTGAGLARRFLGRFDWRWHRFSVRVPVFLYGRQQLASRGHWTRDSDDPQAPTLHIDFRSVDGELWLRDYPASTGPLYEPDWPRNLRPPLMPGARRWAWRREIDTPEVRRRWRAWRQELRRFRRRLAVLQDGACVRDAPR